jgi:hypothetical protein
MSQMVEINLKPDERILRQFGGIALVGFGLLAACAHFEWLLFAGDLGSWRQPLVYGFIGLGCVSALFSLVFPRANLPIFVGLSLLAYPIGFVLSYVIMGALFFGLIAPVAIFFKLTGRDLMDRAYDPDASTYWSEPRSARERSAYFRQF